MTLRTYSVFIALCLACHLSMAWNAAGHKLSAMVAYEHLSPEARTAVAEALKYHPRFSKDFRMPVSIRKKGSKEDREKWLFMQAAIWPDIARGFTGDDRKVYHHSRWHYINEPIFLDPRDEAFYGEAVPGNQDRLPGKAHPRDFNVSQAFHMIMDSLQSPLVTPESRAVLLCWFFHLVGDIHQPLHSSAHYHRQKFYFGDKGGNLIVLGNQSLHSYWDGLLGKSSWGYEKVKKTYAQLESDSISVRESLKSQHNISMDQWISESHALAKGVAYPVVIRSKIFVGAVVDGKVRVTLPRKYFSDYDRNSKQVARRRVYESGLRMALLLEGIYG